MDDLISRKDAIKYMANAIWHYPNYTALNVYENAEELAKDGLANVPSAESTGAMDEAIQHYIDEGYMMLNRPKGEWIEECECSNCHWLHEDSDHNLLITTYKYCPNCGADMRGTNGTR